MNDGVINMVDEEIGKIELDKSTKIIVRLTEWKSEQRVDIRKFVDTERYTGYTKQGISVPVAKIDELKALLDAAVTPQ
ncbi:MAG: transcriptional coactivator p15/PC4 family protein [Methanosarcinales archaeon]|nr:MAG: transcriptional coactivator p15/PC4 family protein [Methanosarcinales archaeon]